MKRKPWKKKASLLSAKQRLEFATWAWNANPCGALLHRMVSNRTHFASDLWLFGQKKPELRVLFVLMRISYIYIYISCRISLYIGVYVSSNTMSVQMCKSEYEYYRQLFQLANLKNVVQTYVSTTAKLAKHWEQLPVTPHLHQRPLSDQSNYPRDCSTAIKNEIIAPELQNDNTVVWCLRGCSPQKSECFLAIKMQVCQVGVVDLGSLNLRNSKLEHHDLHIGLEHPIPVDNGRTTGRLPREISIPWKPSISFMTIEE